MKKLLFIVATLMYFALPQASAQGFVVGSTTEVEVEVEEEREKKEDKRNNSDNSLPFPKGKSKFGFDITVFIKDGVNWMTYGFDYGKYIMNNLYIDGGLDMTCFFDSGYQWKDSNTSLGIPLSIGYSLPIVKNIALDISTGPRFNYIISGKYEYDGETVRYSEYDDLDRFWADWDFGAFLNVYGFKLGIKYQIGLTDGTENMFGIQIGGTF